jgi:hypothetical protein
VSTGPSDPLTRHPERLRIVATRAALPGGDALSTARLQDMRRLPAGRLPRNVFMAAASEPASGSDSA